eukprot:3423382-Amphidinium_carterae.1
MSQEQKKHKRKKNEDRLKRQDRFASRHDRRLIAARASSKRMSRPGSVVKQEASSTRQEDEDHVLKSARLREQVIEKFGHVPPWRKDLEEDEPPWRMNEPNWPK